MNKIKLQPFPIVKELKAYSIFHIYSNSKSGEEVKKSLSTLSLYFIIKKTAGQKREVVK